MVAIAAYDYMVVLYTMTVHVTSHAAPTFDAHLDILLLFNSSHRSSPPLDRPCPISPNRVALPSKSIKVAQPTALVSLRQATPQLSLCLSRRAATFVCRHSRLVVVFVSSTLSSSHTRSCHHFFGSPAESRRHFPFAASSRTSNMRLADILVSQYQATPQLSSHFLEPLTHTHTHTHMTNPTRPTSQQIGDRRRRTPDLNPA
jgi:hypothetical protein